MRDVCNDAPARDVHEGHLAVPRRVRTMCPQGGIPAPLPGQEQRHLHTPAPSCLPEADDGWHPRTSRTHHAGGLPSFNRICSLAI